MKARLKFIINRVTILGLRLHNLLYKFPEKKSGLVIIRNDNLGDFIIFLPLLKRLTSFYQEPATLLVSEASYEFAQGLKERGWPIKEVMRCERHRFNRNIFYRQQLLLQIRKKNFLTAVAPAFSRDATTDLMMVATTAQQRIGWEADTLNQSQRSRKFFSKFYTTLITNPSEAFKEVEKNAEFLRHWEQLAPSALLPIYTPAPQDIEEATRLLRQYGVNKKFVIISPGAGALYRIWPLKKFAAIVDYTHSLGYQVILCGTRQEQSLTQTITSLSSAPVVDVAGKVSLFTLAALLDKASLFLGNEAGLTHLASAVGTPVVCIMGGGHFKRFFPYTESEKRHIVFDPAMACRNDNWACAAHLLPGSPAPCLESITIDMVKSTVQEALGITN